MLVFLNILSQDWNPRQDQYQRPSRVLKEGLEAVQENLVGSRVFLSENVLALVKMYADDTLPTGLVYYFSPDVGLSAPPIDGVIQGL
ncbi:hypothetical protein [Leisingera aquaemixtae]|uniref:hypothetical protein n=1 Tax=Leisingera aquaemixtae TaxID=1396826 RepID=UPI001150349A|nr:hypothetical protein [Leisingera aquaemixtae]QDI77677.1 hypothetical protein R2C4_18665 [Leisingera aquaemixtae]